jgi:hypothetical protein
MQQLRTWKKKEKEKEIPRLSSRAAFKPAVQANLQSEEIRANGMQMQKTR